MTELLFTIALVHFVALMTPGPDFLFVSQTAASRSRFDAMKGVLGIVFGVGVWASLTLIGMDIVFKQFSWLPRVIQLLGGMYLLWLGYILLKIPIRHIRVSRIEKIRLARLEERRAKKQRRNKRLGIANIEEENIPSQYASTNDEQDDIPKLEIKGNTFIYGLMTNLSNPKVIIYFGSVFSPFLDGGNRVNALLKWELLFLIVIETFFWFTLVALLFGLPVMQRFYKKQSVWIDGLAGLFFAGFGSHLIVSLNLTSFSSILTP
ncbi:LysE family transporter [Thorsellia anophelis]|uniref:Threonine/homoserine/homoserine lactone efflux protein n=1 Tax=Thorsellia anophelis DSM 18579 TaxID=1123402 RepID=A0A1I0CRX3_9GAMM|nr:LysE family transporter [Thorsellia anophelis]SET22497.1 Threonine/homoserine/homoserine lactone efflux protein [Thorsellia anophelis DSM 18579]